MKFRVNIFIMVTYSGFSSRKLQDKYNFLLKQLTTLLSQIIITQVQASKLLPFKNSYEKIFKQISKLDGQKYADLKISKIIQPLNQHISLSQVVTEWQSQPVKKKEKLKVHRLSNNYTKTRNLSLEETGRTISFSVSNSPHPARFLHKQNNHTVYEKSYNTAKQQGRKPKKIYRSRQTSINNMGTNQFRHQPKQFSNSLDSDLTMEQLMMKNPLIQRKMSAQKKRRYLKVDFPQIRQEQNEGQDYQNDQNLNFSGSDHFNPSEASFKQSGHIKFQ